jgi:hypothetical protein
LGFVNCEKEVVKGGGWGWLDEMKKEIQGITPNGLVFVSTPSVADHMDLPIPYARVVLIGFPSAPL